MSGPRRGFTFIELIVAGVLCGMLILIALGQVRWAARSSGQAARGAAELLLAADFAERFRNDVRGARLVTVARRGDSVELALADTVVEYRRGDDGRLERAVRRRLAGAAWGPIAAGPTVRSIHFALSNAKPDASGLCLLRARWLCTADADTDPAAPAALRTPCRVLVLDTALRAASEGEVGP
ncbi:MAG: prepilin-type N-terminal cleavage/methylation domain-containing protein [Planctomycetota bacterium]|nr:prepilin-type N-terminal cleavage/methylation domain-containing protein [Planctomycetota bacterium]